jgi:hypothetical protein
VIDQHSFTRPFGKTRSIDSYGVAGRGYELVGPETIPRNRFPGAVQAPIGSYGVPVSLRHQIVPDFSTMPGFRTITVTGGGQYDVEVVASATTDVVVVVWATSSVDVVEVAAPWREPSQPASATRQTSIASTPRKATVPLFITSHYRPEHGCA